MQSFKRRCQVSVVCLKQTQNSNGLTSLLPYALPYLKHISVIRMCGHCLETFLYVEKYSVPVSLNAVSPSPHPPPPLLFSLSFFGKLNQLILILSALLMHLTCSNSRH